MTNWHTWHGHYDDPNSSLSRRLAVVRKRREEMLSEETPPRRLLSLCAGDGRDVIPVLARQPTERRPEATLVEKDPALAAAAEHQAAASVVALTVIVGDAGTTSTWRSATPVDLLMLCGIFGNIAQDDIRRTIAAARAVLRPGGKVIWTRGYFTDEDLRPQIRAWFGAAGFREIAFDSEPTGYGVGLNQLACSVPDGGPPERIFSFVR